MNTEDRFIARLGLTRQTVNQYVKAIYRHFRVNSRAELMAHWIRFARGHPITPVPPHLPRGPQVNEL